MTEETRLSDILVGDLLTPHDPSGAFGYVASVVVIDGALRQVDLPLVLGEYPGDPAQMMLGDEQLESLREASAPTRSIKALLSLLDDDSFVPSVPAGLANLRAYVAEKAPELSCDIGLQECPAPSPYPWAVEGSRALMLVVGMLLLVLLAVGVWIAARAVRGY